MPDFYSIMPVQGNSPSLPTASPSAPGTPSGPTFQDILNRLNQPIGGAANFNAGIGNIQSQIRAPGQLDPGYQAMIDQINNNRNYYGNIATSQASSLAQRRGLAGSSIEQFGVQTGLNDVNRWAGDQTAAIGVQNLQRQQSLQDALSSAYTNRAGQEATIGGQLATTGANLTSDEIASLRNQQFQQQQLQLQQQLGQAGINLGYANIGAGQQLAQRQGQNQLLMGGANLLAPYLLPSILGTPGGGAGLGAGGAGGGGLIPGLFGGGGAGYGMAGGAIGPANYAPLAGIAGSNPGLALAGAGAGAMWLANQGQQIGGTPGAFLANPIGAQLNLARNAISSGGNAIGNAASSVGHAISNVFPF